MPWFKKTHLASSPAYKLILRNTRAKNDIFLADELGMTFSDINYSTFQSIHFSPVSKIDIVVGLIQ